MKHSLQRSTEYAPSGHFFASSVGEWCTDTNLDRLIGCMKRNKLPFNLFYIPLPPDAEYQIRNFAPQAQDAVWLGYWE